MAPDLTWDSAPQKLLPFGKRFFPAARFVELLRSYR